MTNEVRNIKSKILTPEQIKSLEGAVLLDPPGMDVAIVGTIKTDFGHVVAAYSYEKLVIYNLCMSMSNDYDDDDARDFVNFNTVRAVQYLSDPRGPYILGQNLGPDFKPDPDTDEDLDTVEFKGSTWTVVARPNLAPSHLAPSHLAPSHLAPSHLAPSHSSGSVRWYADHTGVLSATAQLRHLLHRNLAELTPEHRRDLERIVGVLERSVTADERGDVVSGKAEIKAIVGHRMILDFTDEVIARMDRIGLSKQDLADRVGVRPVADLLECNGGLLLHDAMRICAAIGAHLVISPGNRPSKPQRKKEKT